MIALGEAGEEGMSLQSIAQALGQEKPAIHRSLGALALKGFVEATGRRGYYRLGPAIYGLARRNSRIESLVSRFRPALMEIAARLEKNVFMMARAGYDAVCVESHTYGYASTLTGGTGGRVPLGVPAGSLALLASLPDATAQQVIAANAGRYESYPTLQPINAQIMSEMVNETRERGYGSDFNLYFPNEGGIGVPIETGLHGEVELSISLGVSSGEHSRAQLDALAAEVTQIITMFSPQAGAV